MTWFHVHRFTCTYDRASNKLVYKNSGTGNLDEFKAELTENAVIFGGYKVLVIDESETVTSRRCKLVQITWIGGSVSPMLRNAPLASKAERVNLFTGTSHEIQANDADMITEKGIAKQLLLSGGAHKPTHYMFGPNKILLSEL